MTLLRDAMRGTLLGLELGLSLVAFDREHGEPAKRAVRAGMDAPVPPKVIEKVVEKEVPVEVEKIVYLDRPRLPLVEWDKQFLARGSPDAPAMEPVYWVMESNPSCTVCEQNWAAVQTYAKPQGWVFSDAGHFRRKVVPFDKPLPTFVLYRGRKELQRLVGRQTPEFLLQHYLDVYRTAKAQRDQATGVIHAGTIGIEQVEQVLKRIGPHGSYQGSNDQIVDQIGIVQAVEPANFGAQWDTKDGVLTINFTVHPYLKWGIFSIPASGIVYDGTTVRLVTPLHLLSPVLTVTGERKTTPEHDSVMKEELPFATGTKAEE